MMEVKWQCRVLMNGNETILNPGDELIIQKGTVQSGSCKAGTRTIHAFGGQRIVTYE